MSVHLKIRLPTGGTLVAPTDPTQELPSDCSRVFGLLPPLASYLASAQCLVKVLQLVGPLTDVIKGLNASPELAANVAKFVKVAATLAPCELAAGAATVLPFVRDLLCVILRAVNCIHGQLTSMVAVATSVTTQLQAARAAGNAELVRALEAAQKNALTRAANVFPSIEAMQAVLELAGPFFAIAGIAPVQLPTLPANADLNTLTKLSTSLAASAVSLQSAVDALGGCDA